MKKLLGIAFALVFALGFAVTTSTHVRASAGSNVVGTYTIADNGQGVWGGGNLRADGSVDGMVAFSAGNGQLVAQFVPSGWSYADASDVQICFNINVTKGDPNAFGGSTFCGVLPVTGTPVKVYGLDGGTTIMRVDMHQ